MKHMCNSVLQSPALDTGHLSLASTILDNIICICPRPFSSIKQVCNSFHPIPTVEDLYIEHQSRQVWDGDAIGSTLWLELLLTFTAVKKFYLSTERAPGIAGALQELVEGRITEVLPSLENIFVEGLEPGLLQENIGKFVVARRLFGHTIVVSVWVSASDGG